MIKYIKQVLFVFLILLTSCGDNFTELQIVTAIQYELDGEECVLDEENTKINTEGVLDVGLKAAEFNGNFERNRTGYKLKLKIENKLPLKRSESGVSYNDIVLEKIETTTSYFISNTDIPIATETFYNSSTIEAEDNNSIAFIVIEPQYYYDLLLEYLEDPDLTTDNKEASLKIKVKVYGRTKGNNSAESNTFEFHARICVRCLIPLCSASAGVPTACYDQDVPGFCKKVD